MQHLHRIQISRKCKSNNRTVTVLWSWQVMGWLQ